MAERPDIVVVGAGIIGCAIALELASHERRVVVVERSVPGAEASTVAAGILAPHVEHPDDPLMASLGEESRELHAAWAERFREVERIDVGFRRTGAMVVGHSASALDSRAAHHAAAGVAHEVLDGAGARALEPALSTGVESAVLLPDEAQVEPPRLLRALALACELSGVRFVRSVVRGVRAEGERVRGVELEQSALEAPVVVIAAGSWTSLVPGAGGPPRANGRGGTLRDVYPVRGQLVHAEASARLVTRLVFGSGGYIVPRGDGRYVCGATTEEAGFEREATLGGIHQVIDRALVVVPGLASARLTGHAVSFRPGTPDGRPLLGRGALEGLWIASGHYRNGILLAPITATLLGRAIRGQGEDTRLAELSPARFERA
ncbi:MAG: glycine oxidase ThiO [Sandaracinaceae bacterium]